MHGYRLLLGQRLILRTEFQTSSEFACSVSVALEEGIDASTGGMALSNQLILGSTNGSIHVVRPVKEQVYHPLQSLQNQLLRTIQHPAALNPRAYRLVRNETVSRPLNRGILDGDLLKRFTGVSLPKMEELERAVRNEVGGVVLGDNEEDDEEQGDKTTGGAEGRIARVGIRGVSRLLELVRSAL